MSAEARKRYFLKNIILNKNYLSEHNTTWCLVDYNLGNYNLLSPSNAATYIHLVTREIDGYLQNACL